METKKIYDLSKLIAFRQLLHSFPEISFQEYETQSRIRTFLISLHIPESSIINCARTGLYIDIYGQAPIEEGSQRKLIGFRAETDALEMKEKNENLIYRSKNEHAAHACGHDGHIVCLLGLLMLFLENRSKIASNRGIRLLFQPSEEDSPDDVSGGLLMREEGCLKEVDEVYAFHNTPMPFGTCYVKSGYVAAEFLNVKLSIHGKGGHAGDPNVKGDPVQPAVDIFVMLRELIKEEQEKGHIFCFTLPCFHAGTANNVFAESAEIKGTFRSTNSEFTKTFVDKFSSKAKEICENQGFVLDVQIKLLLPPIINTEAEAENIKKLAIEYFGVENVSEKIFPIMGSDDFSFLLQEKPGVYFGIGIGRPECQLHCPDYDFNDESIDMIARFWLKIAEDRLSFKANF